MCASLQIWISVSPAAIREQNPDGHRTWTEAEVAQFEDRHPLGTKARLALDLLLYTGVRISDAARLGPQMERRDAEGEKLVFAEQKGRGERVKTHELPILPPMRASIDAYRAKQGAARQLVYLVTAQGQPHSVKGLGNWVTRQCLMAGLDPGLSAHGIRKFRRGALRRGRAVVAAGGTREGAKLEQKSSDFRKKWPTFRRSGARWANQGEKALKINASENVVEAGSGIEPLYADLQSAA
jgi:integrase